MSESGNKSGQLDKSSEKLVQKYVGLEDGEWVVLMVRQHWALFRNQVLLALFVPFVGLFFVYFFNVYPLGWDSRLIYYLTLLLLVICGLAFVAGSLGFLWRLYVWFHTFYVMTNKKIAIISQRLPWEYEVQQIELKKVTDVTLKQTGFQSLIYGYSDVIVSTYSGATFTFLEVGHPHEVQQEVMQEVAKQKRGAGEQSLG